MCVSESGVFGRRGLEKKPPLDARLDARLDAFEISSNFLGKFTNFKSNEFIKFVGLDESKSPEFNWNFPEKIHREFSLKIQKYKKLENDPKMAPHVLMSTSQL